MDIQLIASFLDELEKIATSGSAPKAPKTSAPTPAPAARVAPAPAAKAPVSAPVRPPGGGLAAIRNPGLRAQVQTTRMMRGMTPPPRRSTDTVKIRRTAPAPSVRGVATLPRRTPPQFIPRAEGMGQYSRPMTRQEALGF